jgi:ATP-dependent Clp protease adaptor protein ClpS
MLIAKTSPECAARALTAAGPPAVLLRATVIDGPGESAAIRAGDDDDHGGGKPGGGRGQDQIGLATRTRTKPKKPSQFKVLMLNDDYTPMEFVVICLKRFFNMDMEQATRVMLHVHQKGVGVCGIFPYEIAETKVNQVMDLARQNQHPLQCTLEKA